MEFHHSIAVENYRLILTRRITGTFHHFSEVQLAGYLAEFEFRYSNRSGFGVNDPMRPGEALRGIGDKRLTYRWHREGAYALAEGGKTLGEA